MATESLRASSKGRADELVIPMLLMGHRYINSSAILGYAYLQRMGMRGQFHYKDMAAFLGRSIAQCKKYTSELREAGLIETKWASRGAVMQFVLLETDKK